MSRIEGKDAEQIFAEVRGNNERTRRGSLATAKQQALQTGKEVFDYEHLKTFIDPSGYRSSGRLEEHIGNVEYEYYVGKPSLTTLREFAEFIKEIYKWQE